MRRWLGSNRDLIWLAVILAAGGAVIFGTLGLQSFDTGEAITASRVLHPSVAATFHTVATSERSGPVYYALAWGWSRVFGLGEIGLRSLSALFGVGTIAVMYLVGREAFSRRAGIIAAALTACNPDVLWYAQEARSYPLYIFFTALALYWFVRALRRPTGRVYAAWALTAGVALSTHYFSAFSLGVEGLVMVVAARPRIGGPVKALAAVGAVGLALLPLAVNQEGSGRGNGYTAIPILERGASAALKFVAGEGASTSGNWAHEALISREVGIVALILMGALVAVAVRAGGREERRRAGLVLAVGLVSFAAPLALALTGLDFVEPRNLLGSLAPLIAVSAAGADRAIELLARTRWTRPTRWAPGVAVLVPLVILIVATLTTPRLQRDNFRALAAASQRDGPMELLFTDPGGVSRMVEYYAHEQLPTVTPQNFPCGVRVSRIATIGHARPRPGAGGFTLASSLRFQGRWTAATYVASRALRISAPILSRLHLLGAKSAAVADTDEAGTVAPSCHQRQ
jgi:4-amino-4-deoxy-L-arabinose transferase-like glycosyltransferase